MKPAGIAIILALVSFIAYAGTTSQCEPVMVEGMTISFTNSHGSMTVTAGIGFERRYTWAGDTQMVVMRPRKERWFGSLGMYNPGGHTVGKSEPRKEHDGIKRIVVEEGQRHFTNATEALRWIRQGNGKAIDRDYIYNNTGLVVGMVKLPQSLEERRKGVGILWVDVWQIYINGNKPRKLDGSRNANITVHYPSAYAMETVKPPSQPVDHYGPCEAVMVEAMSISFTNSHGSMTVTAGHGFERRYTWAGDTRTVIMWPHTKRWHGSLGMYNGGLYIKGEVEQWKEHDGIKRFVVEEGQRHFTNTTGALRWIRQGSGEPDNLDYIYNDTGLVVGMDKQPRSLRERKETDFPGTLLVDVWQIYINGKKPQKLEGSKNASITVYYPPAYDMEIVKPPSQPVDHYNP